MLLYAKDCVFHRYLSFFRTLQVYLPRGLRSMRRTRVSSPRSSRRTFDELRVHNPDLCLFDNPLCKRYCQRCTNSSHRSLKWPNRYVRARSCHLSLAPNRNAVALVPYRSAAPTSRPRCTKYRGCVIRAFLCDCEPVTGRHSGHNHAGSSIACRDRPMGDFG